MKFSNILKFSFELTKMLGKTDEIMISTLHNCVIIKMGEAVIIRKTYKSQRTTSYIRFDALFSVNENENVFGAFVLIHIYVLFHTTYKYYIESKIYIYIWFKSFCWKLIFI